MCEKLLYNNKLQILKSLTNLYFNSNYKIEYNNKY